LVLLYGLAPAYFAILLLLEYSQDGGSGGILGRALRVVRGAYNWTLLRCYGVKKVNGMLLLDDGLNDKHEKDDDVTKEELDVLSRVDLQHTTPVVLRSLWKIYPPSTGAIGLIGKMFCRCGQFYRKLDSTADDDNKASLPRRAVRGLTIAVEQGETFGLLGSNGAGKSTTLGILTGDIAPTGGEAYIAGHDISGAVSGGVAKARQNIGCCPQTDPLLDLMTGRETLTMFARLRGVPDDCVGALVERLLHLLTLDPHADKNSDSYSGGNKRKLSLGVAALVGNGGVLLIDESSSGLDPGAR
jgi:ABC-type lipopolysaccharide export system ATPase subunit